MWHNAHHPSRHDPASARDASCRTGTQRMARLRIFLRPIVGSCFTVVAAVKQRRLAREPIHASADASAFHDPTPREAHVPEYVSAIADLDETVPQLDVHAWAARSRGSPDKDIDGDFTPRSYPVRRSTPHGRRSCRRRLKAREEETCVAPIVGT